MLNTLNDLHPPHLFSCLPPQNWIFSIRQMFIPLSLRGGYVCLCGRKFTVTVFISYWWRFGFTLTRRSCLFICAYNFIICTEDFKKEGDRKHYRSRGPSDSLYMCAVWKCWELGYWVRWIIDINFTCSSTAISVSSWSQVGQHAGWDSHPRMQREVLGTEWTRILLGEQSGQLKEWEKFAR